MTGKRKTHTAKFKAEVALAALKGDRTVNELATQYGVHPTLIHSWKKLLATGAEGVFGTAARVPDPTPDQSPALFEQIGRLKVELDFLKSKTARVG